VRWWRKLFFLGAFLFSLVALLPLRIALDSLGFADKGLAARQADGSVWLGALAGARFGTVPLGDVGTRLRLLPLLAGRARLELEGTDGPSAGVTVSRHGVGIDDASGTIEVSGLAGLPPATLDLADVSVRFGNGLCASADGLVKVRIAGELGGAPVSGGFSGQARCEGPALLLPLASQSRTDRIDVSLFADGRYRIDVNMRPGGVPYSQRFEGRF
jgi:general secretion pathway protein N